jgi:hypothetical protein
MRFNCVGLLLVLLASGIVLAQNNVWQENENLDVVLLKKNLAQVIKEAENSSANDVNSLLRKLDLYNRAANNPKIAATVKQITAASDLEKYRLKAAYTIQEIIKDENFKDAETLELFLRQISFDGEIFHKFISLCSENRQSCDINGFDRWLAEKASKTDENTYESYDWVGLRIDFRNKLNLDNTEILNQLVTDLRENSDNFEVALRYLKFHREPADAAWLLENFTSKQAYYYYRLGISLFDNYSLPKEEKLILDRTAAAFLQKSLNLPFDHKDKTLILQHQLNQSSVAPQIGNYEKQLRFWTKRKLAGIYKSIGEAHNAQPIIEELSALDKSDIVEIDISFLAGGVQMLSGARVIESKILGEQATRQDSVKHWLERIEYYRGRKEPEQMFDAYKQMFASVPFDMNDKHSRESRLDLIRRFAGFVEDEFGEYTNKDVELNDSEKQKLILRKDAENFLKNEFNKNSARLKYSYDLAQVIGSYNFNDLLVEIFDKNSQMLLDAFVSLDVESYYYHDLFSDFLGNKSISKARKDAFVNQLEKLAANAAPRKLLFFCRLLDEDGLKEKYAARSIPFLRKQLDKTELQFNSARLSEGKSFELKELKKELVETLFRNYLAINDWKAAENLLMTKFQDLISESLVSVSIIAAQNSDFDDAVRIWKLRANLNRRSLNKIQLLKEFPSVRQNLQSFYQQMKSDETYSPIPDIALKLLK